MRFFSIKNLFFYLILITASNCTSNTGLEYFSRLASGDAATHPEDRFYIRLDTSLYEQEGRDPILYELSDEDDIGLTDCGIDKDDESVEDKYCILDVNEMDILGVEGGTDLPLVYNVPPEMCEYTSFFAPWHWNQRTGRGPRRLYKFAPEKESENENAPTPTEEQTPPLQVEDNDTDNNCEFYIESNTDPCGDVYENYSSENRRLRYFLCGGEQGARRGLVPRWKEKGEDEELSEIFCGPFDLSDNESLANCCIGDYEILDCKEAPSFSSTEEADWGGNVQECIGGPLRVADWDSYLPDENLQVPIPRLVYSWDDGVIREPFNIPRHNLVTGRLRSPTLMTIHPLYSSIGVATYYEGIEDLQWNADEGCAGCPELFFSSKTNYDINNPSSVPEDQQMLAYPYFTLECQDSNFEALHRVHLIIREWNTLEEFLSFQDSDGRSGDPDLEGTEGADCDYYEPDEFNNNNCNDLHDLDDIIEVVKDTRRHLGCQGYPCADYGQAQ